MDNNMDNAENDVKVGKSFITEADVARGARVQKLRRMAGMSSQDLAKKADVSRVTLSFWENATRVKLSEKGARKIIAVMRNENIDCHFSWLWLGQAPEPRFMTPEETKDFEGLDPLFPSTQKEIDIFLRMNKEGIVAKVNSGKFRPYFEYDDIVGGKWQPIETVRSNGYCIVSIHGGAPELRWVEITKSATRAQLSYSPLSFEYEEIEKVKLREIAPVIRLWR